MRYNHNGVISEITSLPGCDQVAVFHNTWLKEDFRGKGKGIWAHTQRLLGAKQLGYDVAICTVASSNETEKAILRKNGWALMVSFKSSKTSHEVGMWSKNLAFVDEVCPKHPKCQEEYEYCTCAKKAGWETSASD